MHIKHSETEINKIATAFLLHQLFFQPSKEKFFQKRDTLSMVHPFFEICV